MRGECQHGSAVSGALWGVVRGVSWPDRRQGDCVFDKHRGNQAGSEGGDSFEDRVEAFVHRGSFRGSGWTNSR